MNITASMLYNYVQCPHRATLDLFALVEQRDPESVFTRLLRERGTLYEQQVIEASRFPFLDLSSLATEEKEAANRAALRNQTPLIYGGRLTHGDLIGEPDLLRLEGTRYVPGDIKSGAGEDGEDDRRQLKRHYALQLAH